MNFAPVAIFALVGTPVLFIAGVIFNLANGIPLF